MSPSRKPEAFSFDGEQAASSPPNTSASPAKPSRKGVFVPLNNDGTLDASRSTPAKLEQVKAALGLVNDTPAATTASDTPKLRINREFIPQAYGLLEVVIQKVGSLLLKWPNELAMEMKFSPEKIQKLVEPTGAVADKYAPKWLVENQEIAALGAALSDAVNDMVNSGSQRYIAKVRAAQEQANFKPYVPNQPTNGVDLAP